MKLDFEDLQNLWTNKDKRLDESLQMDPKQMIAKLEAKSSSALSDLGVALGWDLAIVLLFGIAMGVLVIKLPISVYFWFALVILLMTLAQGIVVLLQMRLFMQTDLAQPLIEVNERLARLRMSRLKLVKWSFVGWCVLWAPFFALLLKVTLGVDVLSTVNSYWWCFNGLSGLVMLLVGYGASRYCASAWERSGFARRLLDALAGKSMTQATRALKELEDFKAS